ncbi:hypothetical protein SCLCIDRAFT_1216046 [Scleroderma citrinum Foug A]|uniref:Uncharacterized protein n=1 Tax=Scleroderma citrinum Foug A TaxID=1036808 RepID=A0A0C3A9J7_9AGAM|nr:hypothetical protein SCLCIDRAFT_1216046 [Scleroderma citrinum Foug A]
MPLQKVQTTRNHGGWGPLCPALSLGTSALDIQQARCTRTATSESYRCIFHAPSGPVRRP